MKYLLILIPIILIGCTDHAMGFLQLKDRNSGILYNIGHPCGRKSAEVWEDGGYGGPVPWSTINRTFSDPDQAKKISEFRNEFCK